MGETVTMAWYDNAVFYHIYPLGLCGCAHENDGQPTPGAFAKLNAWAEHAYEDLGCTAIYIGPLFEARRSSWTVCSTMWAATSSRSRT